MPLSCIFQRQKPQTLIYSPRSQTPSPALHPAATRVRDRQRSCLSKGAPKWSLGTRIASVPDPVWCLEEVIVLMDLIREVPQRASVQASAILVDFRRYDLHMRFVLLLP